MFGFGRGFPMDDPFNDPFFRDPFAGMNHVMNSMLGDPFLGPPPMSRRVPVSQNQNPLANGPIIQEVDDEERAASGTDNQPIVEEPEDEQAEQREQRDRNSANIQQERPYRRSRTEGYDTMGGAGVLSHPPFFGGPSLFDSMLGGFGGGFGGGLASGSSTFSYSSSSYGAGRAGVTYSKTTTTRIGPNGVAEVQETVHDGIAGTEAVKHSRRLGDKERTVLKRRERDGRELHQEQLFNIRDEELSHFDEQWNQQAQRSLPNLGNRQYRQSQSDVMPRLEYQSSQNSRGNASSPPPLQRRYTRPA